MTLDLRDFYYSGLVKIDLGQVAKDLMERGLAGDDTGKDYEEAIRADAFFTEQILLKASAALKRGTVKDLSHAVVLLGKLPVRNFIIGHSILRCTDASADNKFQDFEASRGALKRGLRTEEHSRRCGCEHETSALSAGIMFDIIEHWLGAEQELHENYFEYFELTWKHSLRTAAIAWALASHERVLLHLKKLIFSAALCHELGRLVLLCTYPKLYKPVMDANKELWEKHIDDDSHEEGLDRSVFEVSHSEVGSMVLSKTGFLTDIEMPVDYHHEYTVLKVRDEDMFLMTMVLNMADRLSFMMGNTSDLSDSLIKRIVEPNKQHFPLGPNAVRELLITLRAKGLVSTA